MNFMVKQDLIDKLLRRVTRKNGLAVLEIKSMNTTIAAGKVDVIGDKEPEGFEFATIDTREIGGCLYHFFLPEGVSLIKN
jgi:hypothetical protein